MLTLVTFLILAVGFVLLAIRNWNKTIGAGPTILIVGAIVISMYIPIKWNSFQQKVREYDVCAARVERSVETSRFNDTLISIIVREYPDRVDIAEELLEATVRPLDLTEDCPAEPTFLRTFFTGFSGAER